MVSERGKRGRRRGGEREGRNLISNVNESVFAFGNCFLHLKLLINPLYMITIAKSPVSFLSLTLSLSFLKRS